MSEWCKTLLLPRTLIWSLAIRPFADIDGRERTSYSDINVRMTRAVPDEELTRHKDAKGGALSWGLETD